MINVSSSFINQVPEPGKQKDAYIEYDQKLVRPQMAKVSFKTSLFKSTMKQLDLEIKNNENIVDKKLKFKYGLYVDGAFEYIDYGTFTVIECEEIIKENKIKATAYDNMVKFMVKYNKDHLNLTYPHTLLQLVQAICSYLNVELYSTNFYNADLIIEEDLFTALNCTYRDILDYICQVTLTTAIIKNDKLYFKTIEDVSNRITIGPDILKTLIMKTKFGPCNSLVLGRGALNDNIYSKDDNSIALYGLQEIKFDNNEIIDKRREEVIDGMFQQIKGMKYNTFEATDLGIGFFEGADMIKVQDTQENEYLVLILSASIKITSGTEGTMESDTLSVSTTNYSCATNSEKRQAKTEAVVNKQENKITLLAEETTEHEEKITQIEENLSSIKLQVDNTIDYKREAETVTELHLENAGKADIIKLEIKGNKTYEANLFPGENLYPIGELYPNQEVI